MAYEKESIQAGTPIVAVWGNKIENTLARLGTFIGVFQSTDELPSTPQLWDWALVVDMRSIYVWDGTTWLRFFGGGDLNMRYTDFDTIVVNGSTIEVTETPAGTINGTNTAFTLTRTPVASGSVNIHSTVGPLEYFVDTSTERLLYVSIPKLYTLTPTVLTILPGATPPNPTLLTFYDAFDALGAEWTVATSGTATIEAANGQLQINADAGDYAYIKTTLPTIANQKIRVRLKPGGSIGTLYPLGVRIGDGTTILEVGWQGEAPYNAAIRLYENAIQVYEELLTTDYDGAIFTIIEIDISSEATTFEVKLKEDSGNVIWQGTVTASQAPTAVVQIGKTGDATPNPIGVTATHVVDFISAAPINNISTTINNYPTKLEAHLQFSDAASSVLVSLPLYGTSLASGNYNILATYNITDNAGNLSDGGTIDYASGAFTLDMPPTVSLTATYLTANWQKVKSKIVALTSDGAPTSIKMIFDVFENASGGQARMALYDLDGNLLKATPAIDLTPTTARQTYEAELSVADLERPNIIEVVLEFNTSGALFHDALEVMLA